MADRVRVGLIGCGGQGRGRLSAALATIDEVELTACADLDETMAGRAVREAGYRRPYRDYHDMLAREDLDAVVLATPHHLLKQAALAVIGSGCHAFVEKPMAVNRAEAEEIVVAAREAGVSVMAGFCQRYVEGRKSMKALIQQGAVGDVVQVNAGKASGPLRGWLADPAMGGGQLLYLGVHITDQVLWMVDSAAERVHAEIAWHPQTGADRDSAYTIRFENSVLANVLCSQSSGAGFDFIEVLGTAGRVRSEWKTGVLEIHSQVLPEFRHPTTIRVPPGQMFPEEMREWVTALLEGREPPIRAEDGVRVLAVIDAVFESARSGMAVEVGSSTP